MVVFSTNMKIYAKSLKKEIRRENFNLQRLKVVPQSCLINKSVFSFWIYLLKIVNSNKIMLGKSQEAFTKFIKLALGSYFDYDSVWPWAEREFGLS